MVRVTTPTQPRAVAGDVDGVTTSGTIVETIDGPGYRVPPARPSGAHVPAVTVGSSQASRAPRVRPDLKVKGGARLANVDGINDHGSIVGSYQNRAGVIHGFIDRNGRVQVVNLPKAGTTGGSQIHAISDNGKWIGAATTDDGDSIDYVHLPGRRLAEIRFPRAGMTTLSGSINDAREIGGLFTNDQQRPIAFIAKPLAARS
jgi:uncharacterized membrane protein